MQRYVEMGFPEADAQQAEELYGDDLHAGCHWLMLRQTMGHMPKRLKATHGTVESTYLGSTVRYDSAKWRVDDFDIQHALIMACHCLTGQRRWIHMSDGRIEWLVIRHESHLGAGPKPAWHRVIGQIQFDLAAIEEKRNECTLANVLHMYNRSSPRAISMDEFRKWKMLWALTHSFCHTPTRLKPRSYHSSDLHQFRIELMTYFHALCDVYSVSQEEFNESLYNNTTEATAGLFPEAMRVKMTERIEVWKAPRNYLVRESKRWDSECVPMVVFRPTVLVGNPATFCVCDVVIHDLTFVRPEHYDASMNVVHMQCLFRHIFASNMNMKTITGSMDDEFLKNTLRSSRKSMATPASPSQTFRGELFTYQTKCLSWLIERETTGANTSSWGWTRHDQDDFVFHTSCFGFMSRSSPNNTVRGGLLAQSVGMGKTVEMLALIATHHSSDPTLVVVPTTMLSVWMSEAAKYCPELRTVLFHGPRRSQITMDQLRATDIVVTTYRICVNETQRHVPTLGGIRWGRIILDESHELKSPLSATARAMCRLYAPLRWCISATPYPKGLQHMASLLAFMGVTPFVEMCTASTMDQSSTPMQVLARARENQQFASLVHQLLCDMTFWQQKRHVRLDLPPVTHVEDIVPLENADVYQALCASIRLRRAMDAMDTSHHRKARSMHYMRWLRLASTHYAFNATHVYGTLQDNNRAHSTTNTVDAFIESLGSTEYDQSLRGVVDSWLQGNETCAICRDVMEHPALTPCQHMFCYECIQSAYEHDMQRRCPLCRKPAGNGMLRELQITGEVPSSTTEQLWTSMDHLGYSVSMPMSLHRKITSDATPLKIRRLLYLIHSSDEKCVVFTQYRSVMHLVGARLDTDSIPYVSIEGRMTPNRRANSIERFQTSDDVKVFLMTTKTASVGITLTAASRIFFIEPCLDIHVRKQAIGRAWRIGQTKPIQVTTLRTADTFEGLKTADFEAHLNSTLAHD